MVTLVGFFFILSNVICLEIFMPDLVGPVRTALCNYFESILMMILVIGAILVVLQLRIRSLDVLYDGQC